MSKPKANEIARVKHAAHEAGWKYVWIYEDGTVYGSQSLSSESEYIGTVKDCANYVETSKEIAP